MNSITIDSKLYQSAEAIAKSRNMSAKQLIEDYIHALLNSAVNSSQAKNELDLAHDDLRAGRVTTYTNKDDLYKDLGI